MTSSTIFLGARGNVIALDRASGQELWRTPLKGGDFVNVVVDGDLVIAATRGEAFGLDATSGRTLWHNELPDVGYGLISIAIAGGAASGISPFEKKTP
jgi:outer membrane protein assembly factor BamB